MARRVSQPGFSREEEVRITPLSRIRSVPFLGLLLLGLLASGFAGPLPGVIRFLASFSLVTWIPGCVLAGRWLRVPAAGPLEKVALWVAAGLGAVSVATWIAALAGVSFDRYAAALQWLLALTFAGAAVLDWKSGARKTETAAVVVASPPLRLQGGMLAVAALLALLTAVDRAPADYGHDSFDHIGYVRRVQLENSLTPGGVLAEPSGDGTGRRGMDPRKGTIHPIVAAAARMADVDPVDAWGVVPVVVFPVAFLAFLWFCAPFVPRPSLLVACAALYVMFQGGAGVWNVHEFANGQQLCVMYYWTMVPLSLRYIATGHRGTLAAVLVVLAGGAFLHIGAAMHFAILSATLLLFHRWLGMRTREVLVLCAWGLAVVVIAVAWKAVHSLGPGNDIHVHPQGLLYVTDRLYVASPVEVLRENGLLFLGGLLLFPFMAFAARTSRFARLHLAFAAIPLTICFIPFVTPLLYERAAYMVFRSLLNVPVFAAIAASIYGIAVWSRRRGWAVRATCAVALLLWAGAFLSPSIDAFARETVVQRNASRESLFDRYGDLLEFLRSRPVGSVVLSDARTSYLISAATGHHVVAVYGQHGNPNDRYAFDRLAAVRDVLSPYVAQSQAVAACDRYRVDFVVVNGRLRDAAGDFWTAWNPALFPYTREKLSLLDTHFRPVLETDDVVVYLYYPGAEPEEAWSPQSTPVEYGLEGLDPCAVNAPDGTFDIVAADVLPARTLPGEWVTITLGYEVDDVHRYSRPYTVYVRFDHQSIAGSKREYPLEKHVRRWRERRSGQAVRFRFNHSPFQGDFPADQWPIAVTFYESFDVKLPANLEPGTYTIEFKIDQDTLLPNFWVRDFVFNRDHYSGTPCLDLEVTRQLVR